MCGFLLGNSTRYDLITCDVVIFLFHTLCKASVKSELLHARGGPEKSR